jgi:hypothetical protein
LRNRRAALLRPAATAPLLYLAHDAQSACAWTHFAKVRRDAAATTALAPAPSVEPPKTGLQRQQRHLGASRCARPLPALRRAGALGADARRPGRQQHSAPSSSSAAAGGGSAAVAASAGSDI